MITLLRVQPEHTNYLEFLRAFSVAGMKPADAVSAFGRLRFNAKMVEGPAFLWLTNPETISDEVMDSLVYIDGITRLDVDSTLAHLNSCHDIAPCVAVTPDWEMVPIRDTITDGARARLTAEIATLQKQIRDETERLATQHRLKRDRIARITRRLEQNS